MQEFTLPANIKQIGSIGDGLRIYMEDYVCTFLQQYAESAGFEERIAFLVGKQMVIDGQQYLFIGGAIYGKYSEKFEGHLRFSEKSVDYAEEMLDEFFPNMEIVGWMQSQPSYGTYLNQYYGAYHLRQFRKAHQVMFVVDPLERTNAFYTANPVAVTPADRMAEIEGYFIYYEKNKNMHDYMLANKSVEFTAKPPTLVELTPVEYTRGDDEAQLDGEEDSPVQGYDDYYDDGEKHTEGRFSMHGPNRKPEEVIRRRENSKAKRRGNMLEQKRTMNLIAGLCAVLFVVSFVMGVELIRNQDRIENNEAQIRQLTTALRNHLQVDANAFAELAPVFAEGDTPTITAPTTITEPPVPQPPAPPPSAPAPQVQEAPAVPPQQPPVTEPVTPPVPPPPQPPTPTAEETTTAAIITMPHEEAALIPPIPESYTIQPGDSLLGISLYFFGDANMVYEILALNGIENPNHIIAGRTIVLPQR